MIKTFGINRLGINRLGSPGNLVIPYWTPQPALLYSGRTGLDFTESTSGLNLPATIIPLCYISSHNTQYLKGTASGIGAGDFYYYFKGTIVTDTIRVHFSDGGGSTGGKRLMLWNNNDGHLTVSVDDNANPSDHQILAAGAWGNKDWIEFIITRVGSAANNCSWTLNNLTAGTTVSGVFSNTLNFSSAQTLCLCNYLRASDGVPINVSSYWANNTVAEFRCGVSSSDLSVNLICSSKTGRYVYDASGNAKNVSKISNNAAVQWTYNSRGSTYNLDNGWELWGKEGSAYEYVPKGTASTFLTDLGYIKTREYTGSATGINKVDCLIGFNETMSDDSRFDIFDRSDETIFNAACRASAYYSSTNLATKSRFHVSELERYIIESFTNTGYKYRIFPSFNQEGFDQAIMSINVFAEDQTNYKTLLALYKDHVPIDSLTYEQLAYHIDAQQGDKIFGFDPVNDKIFYSSNNGVSFTIKDFTDADEIGFSFIFPNGNILWSDADTFYLSTDGLGTWNTVSPTYKGDAFIAVAGNRNYVNVRFVEAQLLTNGKTLITWGNYVNTSLANKGYPCLFASINGEDVKVVYMFSDKYDYGDAANPVDARHIHSSTFSEITGKWYWNTGDFEDECHFVESEYDQDLETWSTTILTTGDNDTRRCAASFFERDGLIIFGTEAVGAGDNSHDGMWIAPEENLGNLASHIRLLNYDDNTLSGSIRNDNHGLVIPAGNVPYNGGLYQFITFCHYKEYWNLHSLAITPAKDEADPTKYVGWKIIKVSDTIYLCNVMELATVKYRYNTVKITLT